MVAAHFPLPRAMLPKPSDCLEVHTSARVMMDKLLEHTVGEFETLSSARNGVVDMDQWRALSSSQAAQNGQHDPHVKVYSERECGAISGDLSIALQASAADEQSTFAALPPSAVLVSGRAPGNLDNTMFALGGAHTQEGLALYSGVMYDDIADCGVLHTLDSGDERSCRFLGYKYVVKCCAASSSKLVRYRDMVYLEFTGYTQTSTGERLGFHIEHSVGVRGFPDLYDCNSSHVLQSVRYLFRQKSERSMEIFMLGNLQLAGVLNVGGVGAGGSNGAGGSDLLSISKLQQCAEIRRLTQMVFYRRETRELLLTSSGHQDTECFLCRRKKRFFSGSALVECVVCGQFVCSKCRDDKKLFVRDGLVGKFRRVQPCKTCVVTSTGFTSRPMYVEQMTKSPGLGKTGSVGSASVRHYGASKSKLLSFDGYSESFKEGGEIKDTRRRPRLDLLQETDVHHLPLSSRVFEEHRGARPSPGPIKREFSPVATLAELSSISKTQDSSGMYSSSSNVSFDGSYSSRSRDRGIYLTPPNPSKLYEEGKQNGREIGLHHQLEPQRQLKHTHQLAQSMVVQSEHQPVLNQRQLARTLDHDDLPGHDVATAFSSSYSSTIAIAPDTTVPKYAQSDRGLQRTISASADNNGPSRTDMMVQMMELNMKAEKTFNTTQVVNGVFLEPQMRTRQYM